jgi:serine/threonine-protein kinase RsbW
VRKRGLSEEFSDYFRLAVEEAAVNVCRYAYGGSQGELELSIKEKGGLLVVELSDAGAPFDPTTIVRPDVARSVREGKMGGLGIHLMKSMAERVSYRRTREHNVLTLTFAKAKGEDDDSR